MSSGRRTQTARSGSATSRIRSGERRARKANRSRTGAALARGGLGARGIIYLILSFISVDIAVNTRTKTTASSQGAVDVVAHQPAGPFLVIVLAAGFAAYAAWRLLQAAAGDAHEKGGRELAKRLGWTAIGVAYLSLALSAVLEAFGHGSHTNQAFSLTHSILELPAGQVILAVVGTGVVTGGLWLATWAGLQRFDRYLTIRKLPPWLEAGVHVVETFGNIVRGLAFAGIGASFIVAAFVDSASEAKGLNGTLRSLASHTYGRVALGIASAGFLAFGVASLLEAYFRDVDENATG